MSLLPITTHAVKAVRDALIAHGYNPTLIQCVNFVREVPLKPDDMLRLQIEETEARLAVLRNEFNKRKTQEELNK